MTNKELKKLNRRELLEMLISQSRELERLQKELEKANRQLNDRRILLADTGSIAEAALKLNHVFEAAQEAADQYLENITGGKNEGGISLQDAQTKANEILRDAENKRKALLKKTEKECAEMRAKAEEECRQKQYDFILQDILNDTAK